MTMNDADLERAVLRELRQEPRLDGASLLVSATCGTVTLTGTVGTCDGRTAAREAAQRVPGITEIRNGVIVGNPVNTGGTNQDVARAVRDALDRAFPATDAARIDATVAVGWVTLTGHLDGWTQRVQAEAVVGTLAGVRGVVNRIAIAPAAQPAKPFRECADRIQTDRIQEDQQA